MGLLAALIAAWAVVHLSRPPTDAPKGVDLAPPGPLPRDPFERDREPPSRPPLPALDRPETVPAPGPSPAKTFHCALQTLPDGRVEFFYGFEAKEELRDWRHEGPGEPTLADGEVRFGGPEAACMIFTAPFVGDIEIGGTWRQIESIQPTGDCSVSFCNQGGERYYAASLATYGTRIFKNSGQKEVSKKLWECVGGKSHTFRIVREGDSIRVSVDGQLQVEAADKDYTRGAVGLGAWFARVAIEEIRITGRLDPAWLAVHPGAAKEIEGLKPGGGKGQP